MIKPLNSFQHEKKLKCLKIVVFDNQVHMKY